MSASPFDAITLAALRARRSAKWSVYPTDVLPAWIAEMDVALAAPVKAALHEAIDRDDCGYADADGLFVAFAGFAERWFGWHVDPSRLFLVPDVLVGLLETLRLLTLPGERVAINSPVYPPFYTIVREAGRAIADVPLLRTVDGWELDLEGLERAFTAGVRVFLLCSPHNPTGRVFPLETLSAVAALARRYGVLVISDEVHAPLTLAGARHTPFVTLAEPLELDAVVLTSASKAWNLAGLKCALLVAGSERMRQRLTGLPPEVRWRAGHLGVLAAVAAFREGMPWLGDLLRHLDRNRARFGELLRERIPAACYVAPQASYLAWVDCSALGLGDDPQGAFLQRGRVALTRGREFGGIGPDFVRVNMGTSADILTEIVARMAAAL